MDISDTIAPTSEQMDAVDLLAGPRTFTIERASRGSAEQPVNIHLVEFDRPWRPGKSMRRVLVACWGADASQYAGRRVTLYCDPNVMFGGVAVGGTRISAMSHINKPRSVPLIVTRGKSIMFKVQPLKEEASKPAPTLAQRIATAVDLFAKGGVDQVQLEQRIGRPRGEWTAEDMTDLTTVFQALRAGEVTTEEAFPPVAAPVQAAPAEPDDVDPTLDPSWGQG